MSFQKSKKQPEFSDLNVSLARAKDIDNSLYQTIQEIINRLGQFRDSINADIAAVKVNGNGNGNGNGVSGPHAPTHYTAGTDPLDIKQLSGYPGGNTTFLRADRTFGAATGPQGPQGIQGPVGPQGPQGIQGNTGATGSQGPQGTPGATGSQGPQGIQGPIGPTGATGSTGNPGAPGDKWFAFNGPPGQLDEPVGAVLSDHYLDTVSGNTYEKTGLPNQWTLRGNIKGPQGPIGNTGPTGPASTVPGPTGPQGIQGPQGVKGDTGNTGSQGIQGPQGNVGPQGPIGPEGPEGPIGPEGTGIEVKGTVPNFGALPPTGNSDGDAWITSDTGHMWVWDTTTGTWVDAGKIVGPAGPQGSQGVQGPQGIQGPIGPIGPQGVKGDTGTTGSQGPIGNTGPEGPQGIKGDTGSQGPQGNTGAQGIQGPQGNQGTPGEKWFTGAGAPSGSLSGSIVGDWYIDSDNGDYYEKTGASAWTLRGNLKGPPGTGVVDAQYWVSTAHATLSAERNLGALTSGYVKSTVATGVSTPSTVASIPAADGGTGVTTGLTVLNADNLTSGTVPSGRLIAANLPAHASRHNAGGADAMAIDAVAATGSLRTLGTGSTQAAAGNDSRFTDSRTPTAHATTHKSGGTDVIKLDELAAPTDITTLNASTSAHGLMQKYPGGTTNFLRADGTFAAPSGSGGAHQATHQIGGGDTLLNAAWVNQANVFTQDQTINKSSPTLTIYDAAAGTDYRRFDIRNSSGALNFEAKTDAGTLQSYPLYLTRANGGTAIAVNLSATGSAGNVACKDQANIFTQKQVIKMTSASLSLHDDSASAGTRRWNLLAFNDGNFYIQTHDDGGNWSGNPLLLTRAGNLTVAGSGGNVACKDQANTFTQNQTIGSSIPRFTLNNTTEAVDARVIQVYSHAQSLYVVALNDAQNLVQGLCYMTRPGDWVVGRDVYEKGRLTPMGQWVAFTPSLFTDGGGAIALTSNYSSTYTLIGKTMILSGTWSVTLSGTPIVNWYVSLPEGKVCANRHAASSMAVWGPTGTPFAVVYAVEGQARLQFNRDITGGTTWPTGGYSVTFTHTFDFQ